MNGWLSPYSILCHHPNGDLRIHQCLADERTLVNDDRQLYVAHCAGCDQVVMTHPLHDAPGLALTGWYAPPVIVEEPW